MFAYPSAFPLVEIKNVIDIVRSGDLISQKEALAHDAWVVQGYAQSMLIGAPTTAMSAQDAIDPLEALEKAAAAAESDTPTAQISIPWAVIAKYVTELLLQILLSQ